MQKVAPVCPKVMLEIAQAPPLEVSGAEAFRMRGPQSVGAWVAV